MSNLNFLLNFGRRLASPFLAQRADDIVEGTLDYAVRSPQHLEGWLPETGQTLHSWLRDEVGQLNLGGTWSKLKQEFHYPDMVIGMEDAGKKILDAGTNAQLSKGVFLHPILESFNKARSNIQPGSRASIRVFEALENPEVVKML